MPSTVLVAALRDLLPRGGHIICAQDGLKHIPAQQSVSVLPKTPTPTFLSSVNTDQSLPRSPANEDAPGCLITFVSYRPDPRLGIRATYGW